LKILATLQHLQRLATILESEVTTRNRHKLVAHQIALLYVSNLLPSSSALDCCCCCYCLLPFLKFQTFSQTIFQQAVKKIGGRDVREIKQSIEDHFEEIKTVTESENPVLSESQKEW
jgi:hypothetical protein